MTTILKCWIWIINSIPKDILSEKAFNKKARELIDNLAFIYNVDSLQMVEFIRKSLNEFGMIDKDSLRQTVRKYYQRNSHLLQHSHIHYLL